MKIKKKRGASKNGKPWPNNIGPWLEKLPAHEQPTHGLLGQFVWSQNLRLGRTFMYNIYVHPVRIYGNLYHSIPPKPIRVRHEGHERKRGLGDPSGTTISNCSGDAPGKSSQPGHAIGSDQSGRIRVKPISS